MNLPRPFVSLLHWFGLGHWLDRSRRATAVPDLPLTPDAPDAARARVTCDFLADVQGGIVSARSRGTRVALWLFAFIDPADYARNARTVNATADRVTTALDQYRGRVGGSFRSFALSGSGLKACGVESRVPDGSGFCPPDMLRSLLDGMSQEMELGWMHDPVAADGTPSTWEPQFLRRIDGVWLLGADSPEALELLRKKTVAWGQKQGAYEVAFEPGAVRRDTQQRMREPFGFVDGLSTQRFFRDDPFALKTPLEKVFLATPRHLGCSLLVVRKLEQNVKAFRTFRQQLIDQLGADAGERKASQIVGRLPDGTPLAGRSPGAALNDFDFSNDRAATGCPFTAHIRRANPRAVRDDISASATPAEKAAGERHLVRRGVVYGSEEKLNLPAGATAGVGLLFMAYMSELATFREIQGSWFSAQNFPAAQPVGAADALVHGSLPAADDHPAVNWITPKGGGYFFVPSRSWMRDLRPETR